MENMYNYQKYNRYFAQAANDILPLVEDELKQFGASDIKHGYRGLYFNAGTETIYRANYESLLINRILAPIISFDCHSDKYLYQTANKINWEDFLSLNETFAIFATVTQSKIKHSKFAAQRLKDAIADYFTDKFGKRPSVDTREPDLWLNLHIERNKAIISVDTSGGSLHRRGYRKETHEAPMSETVAATIINYSEWDGKTPLYDPFCGSGTLLCEAYLRVTKTPPSFKRNKFGFEQLPGFDKKLWEKVKESANSKKTDLLPGLISGSDISFDSIAAAKINCSSLDNSLSKGISKQDVFKLPELENKIIITNPPYGLRLNKNEDLSGFYKNLGDFLKQKCNGSEAYIYFGERKYLKSIGLRAAWKKPLINGGLDGRLAKFELY